MVNFILEMIN